MIDPPPVENIRTTVEGAFRHRIYPGDDGILEDPYHCLDCLAEADFFVGKDWKTIPSDVLRLHTSALFLFTGEALRFFLPAFLIAVLDYENADTIEEALITLL